MNYDLVINNGKIISFGRQDTFSPSSIGISKGKITTISETPLKCSNIIDAKGLIICPGFIDFHSHVNGRPFSAECLIRQGATTTIGGERNFEPGIIRKIESDGFIINQGFYVSYSFTLRKAVGLQNPMQIATQAQINNMKKLAERFFEFGVLGMHFGLEYMPGTTESELESLLQLTKEHNKIAMVHLRHDGYQALESLDEIIRVAKKTGAAINILHIMYMVGIKDLLEVFLRKIENARKNGCNITADTGVYSAFPSLAGSLTLGDNFSKKYRKQVSEKNIVISSGTHIGAICDRKLFEYIRKEYPTTLVTAFMFDESEIEEALKPDYMMVSTNAAYGPHLEGIGHPESTGTYPKLISNYVVKKPVLSIKDAIKKITYLPATRLGLKQKGNIIEGADADITIFNEKEFVPKSNFTGYGNPTDSPEGLKYVIINGHIVLSNNDILNENRFCGKLLKNF